MLTIQQVTKDGFMAEKLELLKHIPVSKEGETKPCKKKLPLERGGKKKNNRI